MLNMDERLMAVAAYAGDEVEVLKLLSDARLDINAQFTIPNHQQLVDVTAMHIAICQGNNSVARIILKHPKYQMTPLSKDLMTALHFAALSDQIGALATKMLAHPGAVAAVNLRDIYGRTALHYACVNSNVVWLRELLKIAQIETSPVTMTWITPMQLAAVKDQMSGLEELLNRGVDCNVGVRKVFPYINPLSAAIIGSVRSNVELLLNHGAATTYTATLDLILSSDPNSQMESIGFECANMVTLYIRKHLSEPPLTDEKIKTAEKLLEACPQPADVETIFMLYQLWFKSEEPDNSSTPHRKLRLLCRVIYKSLGTGIDEHLQKYLINKYKLTDSEDYRLLIPFRSRCLRHQSALKAREDLMRRFEAGNVTQALRLAESQLNRIIGRHATDLMYLDWLIDHYINEITSKGLDFHSIFQ